MNIRKAIVWLLCVLLMLGLAGCAMAGEQVTGNAAPDDYIVKEDTASDAENTGSVPEDRKFIRTASMTVETDNLDTVLQQVDNRVAELSGYIEHSKVQNGNPYDSNRSRSATITVRVPSKDMDAFLDKVGQITNIVASQKQVEDITLNYVATESRIKALQTQEARLLELIAKAETLSDLLTMEKRLNEVRTELEGVTASLKVMDSQVEFATIHLSITEVKVFTEVTEPESVWERMGNGFMKSLKGVGHFFEELLVFAVTVLPYLLMLAVIPLGVLLVIHIHKRRKRRPYKK